MRQIDHGLFMAVERGDPEAVLDALAAGADPRVFNHEGCTALMMAAFKGSAPCVAALAPASDPNAQCAEAHAFCMTALMLAAGEGHADCVELLVPVSDGGLRDKMGQTALHLAAYGGSRECVELLLGACDPRALDALGKSALAQAVDSGRSECARALLPASDADQADNSGFSPLSAAVLNQDIDCARVLLPASSPANRAKALASANRRGGGPLAGLIEAYELSLAEKAALRACAPGPEAGDQEGSEGSGKGRRL